MAAKKRPIRRQQPQPSSASRVPQRLTSDTLVYAEYEITDEPLDNRAIKRLPSQVQARMDDLYALAQHDPIQAIPESDTPGKAGGLMSRTASKAVDLST